MTIETVAFETHDYTDRSWGHDYIFNPIDPEGIRARMMGWGHGIKNNDYLIIPNGKGTTRYQVISIEYLGDPPDMWNAYVKFAPRP